MGMHAENTDSNVFRFDQSGALLRKVMESAAVGMALVGIDRRTIWVNKAYEAMLGFTPGERLGQSSEGVSLRLDQVLRGEIEDMSIECPMNHADGHPVWALIPGSLLRRDATGKPLYV